MLSYENSYHVNLENSLLPMRDLVLAHVSIDEKNFNVFETNLQSLIPTAIVLDVKRLVLTPEGEVAREFEWLDIEIYIPKTEVNRSFNGFNSLPELLCQAVAGTNPLIAMVEVINLTDDVKPIFFRREFGDMKLLPFAPDYKFVFQGVSATLRLPSAGIPIYRAYTGAEWFVNSNFDAKLSEDDAQYRPSKSILFALALHAKGFWVFGRSILEAATLANEQMLKTPSTTLNKIAENLWKLNPEIRELKDYQVYHRALHAYKMAFGMLTPELIASILTNPNYYTGLAEYLVSEAHPGAPELRTYIAENIILEEGRYGIDSKEMTDKAPGGL